MSEESNQVNESQKERSNNQSIDKNAGLYGAYKFKVKAFTDDEIKDLRIMLNSLTELFPERFKNPFSGYPVEANISYEEMSSVFVFSVKGESDEKKSVFFGLKPESEKAYRVDFLRNQGSLFILTLLSALYAIDKLVASDELIDCIEKYPTLLAATILKETDSEKDTRRVF